MLEQVYVSERNLDEELVNSIVWPAQDTNAAEVFYRIITGKGTPVNVLLDELNKVQSICYASSHKAYSSLSRAIYGQHCHTSQPPFHAGSDCKCNAWMVTEFMM